VKHDSSGLPVVIVQLRFFSLLLKSCTLQSKGDRIKTLTLVSQLRDAIKLNMQYLE
jgi:hypothetical protein